MRLIDYQALDALAREWMGERKAHLLRERGFIYHHGKRVAVAVIALRGMETDDDSHDDALRIAGMFHDLGKGIEPHGQSGAALAREMLAAHLPEALLGEVADLIGAHCDHAADGLWPRLLQDADILDHFGAVELGISFQHGAYTEGGMGETLAWYENDFTSYAERTRQKLHFDSSRAIYDEKVAFTQAVIERMRIEMTGAYIGNAPNSIVEKK